MTQNKEAASFRNQSLDPVLPIYQQQPCFEPNFFSFTLLSDYNTASDLQLNPFETVVSNPMLNDFTLPMKEEEGDPKRTTRVALTFKEKQTLFTLLETQSMNPEECPISKGVF